MKNRLKKLNIFFIVLCIIISSIIPTAAFAASEDDLRSSVVSIASDEVGYTGTSSYSKYGDWYGYQGGWCTTFVLWCFNKAGKQNGVTLNGVIIPRGGNCSSMISWFKDKGRYYSPSKYTPKSGDLIFFDWTGSGTADHVGIVNYTSGTTVYTIEGNCSGKVKAREYTKKGSKPYNNISSIIGYASPKFSSISGSSAGKTTTKKHTTTKKAKTTKKTTASKKVTTKKATTAKSTTKKATSKKTATKRKQLRQQPQQPQQPQRKLAQRQPQKKQQPSKAKAHRLQIFRFTLQNMICKSVTRLSLTIRLSRQTQMP